MEREFVGLMAPPKKPEITDEEAQRREIERGLLLLRRQQAILKSRESFMDFVKFTSPDPAEPNDVTKSTYENALHHDAVAAALQEVEKGNYQFLILTMPPRHGKSELVSRRFPAWFMGRHPDWSTVVATYNDDFAMDFGAEVRKIMASTQYKSVFPDCRLVRGGQSKDRLQTTQGGMATFVGVGGSLTGRGAHCLIIDDLIKDYEQARSKAFRDRAWEWFTKVAMTRRMGPKLVIITFTRWHQDDIIGRLTDPENEYYNRSLAEKIKIIDLPAIAGEDDPLGRAPGQPLWDRYDLEFLEEQRTLDPLGFEALYQQRPSLMDGDLFKRETMRFYEPSEIDESDLRIYCASDHAVDTKQRSDYTVLLRVGVDRQLNIYLLDCWWQKQQTDVVVEAMLQMFRQQPAPLVWWAERGHISKSIGPFLRRRMSESGTFGNLVEVTPAADKAQRAQSIVARAAMGKLFFPKGKPWVERAINEMMAFPNGLHDDFVDALAYIGLGLQAQIPVNSGPSTAKAPRYGTLGWWKAQQKGREPATTFGGF
jgi:predicted phage terminase large subunit-like protein